MKKTDTSNDRDSLKRKIESAKAEVEEVGGLAAFKSGDWFINLIRKCFRNYYERATSDYFSAKYPGFSEDKLLSKIIPPHSPTPVPVLTVSGAACTNANSLQSVFLAVATAGLTHCMATTTQPRVMSDHPITTF